MVADLLNMVGVRKTNIALAKAASRTKRYGQQSASSVLRVPSTIDGHARQRYTQPLSAADLTADERAVLKESTAELRRCGGWMLAFPSASASAYDSFFEVVRPRNELLKALLFRRSVPTSAPIVVRERVYAAASGAAAANRGECDGAAEAFSAIAADFIHRTNGPSSGAPPQAMQPCCNATMLQLARCNKLQARYVSAWSVSLSHDLPMSLNQRLSSA